jgi:alkylated DNA nucleotide flippase Atl1
MEKSLLWRYCKSFRDSPFSKNGRLGNECSHNRDDVPAHRVVNRNGLLTGKFHFDGTNLMQQLLESEGIEVVENQIVDFEKHFWEPPVSEQ